MKRPRAVLGYVSETDWAFKEFYAMTYASWHQNTVFRLGIHKVDIFVFVHPSKWAAHVAAFCTPLDLDAEFDKVYNPKISQCFAITYPPPPHSIWFGYPFINNVHFFADPRVQRILTQHYGYAMKTDFDTFLSPAIATHFPEVFTFGVQEYVVKVATSHQLVRIASKALYTMRNLLLQYMDSVPCVTANA